MKKYVLFFLSLIPITGVMGQPTVTYELLPDSTITPHNGSSATGPAQSLTGYFSCEPGVLGGPKDDDYGFILTSLDFTSSSYSLTLGGTVPRSSAFITYPSAQTTLIGYVNSAGSTMLIATFADGSFQGPESAPTQLTYNNIIGMGPSAGGLWVAYLNIDAEVVPEPATWPLFSVGAGGLMLLGARRKCTV